MKLNRRAKRKGFTLIELAIIIAIVGILAAAGAARLMSMTNEAQAASGQTMLANCRSALAIAIAKDMSTDNTYGTRDGKVSYTEFQYYMPTAKNNPTTKTQAGAGSTTYPGLEIIVTGDQSGTQFRVQAIGSTTDVQSVLSAVYETTATVPTAAPSN